MVKDDASTIKLMQMIFHTRFRHLENVCNLPRRGLVSISAFILSLSISFGQPKRGLSLTEKSPQRNLVNLLLHAFFYGILTIYCTNFFTGFRRVSALFKIKKHNMPKIILVIHFYMTKHTKYTSNIYVYFLNVR